MAPKTRWFFSTESKKHRVIHLAGHARLGAQFAKCGKTLGREIAAASAPHWDACGACERELNNEIERARKKVQMEASAGSVKTADQKDARYVEDIIITVRRRYLFSAPIEADVRLTGEFYEDMVVNRGAQIEEHIARARKKVADRHQEVFPE